MTDQDAFIRAIVEDPADITPRLIYADWLEERGHPRAEFIRVQCELDDNWPGIICFQCKKTNKENRSKYCGDGSNKDYPHRWETSLRTVTLRNRERELLHHYARHWVLPLARILFPGTKIVEDEERSKCYDKHGNTSGAEGHRTAHWVFRRGFIEVVTLRLQDWIGEECPRPPIHILKSLAHDGCQLCLGTSRIGAHGPEIVKACPVREVVVSDQRPLRLSPDEWAWFMDEAPTHFGTVEARLPWFIFRLMKSEPAGQWSKAWSSEAAARAALSDALIAWAKK